MGRLSTLRVGRGKAVKIGTVDQLWGISIPDGWLPCEGTIGAPGSGATTASLTMFRLFEHAWTEFDNATVVIQDSSGSNTTRGVSPIADFNAGKRIPLCDLRGEFIRGADNGRGVDSGRQVGTAQGTQFGQHTHPNGTLAVGTANAPHNHPAGPLGGPSSGYLTGPGGPQFNNAAGSGPEGSQGINFLPVTPTATAPHGHPLTGAIGNQGGTPNSSETRPRNYSLNLIIKF
jgi:hypothetical protein